MCGIVGLNFPPHQDFHKALQTLHHRGPDFSGIYTYENHTFGHARLAIVDLHSEANQPMVFDGIIITFNGEIYNYKELITEESLTCQTASDTEVIIRLYQKYGTDFIHLLQGMFAFSIYDIQTSSYFCARDRFGKKPFYYFSHQQQFAYASEIKALLKLLPNKPELNLNALDSYLSYQAPINAMTFFNHIHKLEAGCYLIANAQGLEIKRYYALDEKIQEPLELSKAETLSQLQSHLHTALQRRLVGDETIASFLSGGLDSSFISALYSQVSSQKIDTFSIGYGTHSHYSELPFAKKVAAHIHSNHHEIIMNKSDFIENLEQMLDVLDEPLGDSASIPTLMLSQAVHEHGIKVALSGEGSDECFLGYAPYFSILDIYNQKTMKPDKQHFLHQKNLSHQHEYQRRFNDKEPIFGSLGETFMTPHKSLLYKNDAYINNTNFSSTKPIRSDQLLSYTDYKIWVSEVLMSKLDRMSMAHSLEVRAPFLDHELVEFSLRLPANLRIGSTPKDLLKKVANNYLPQEIVHRQKKGFSSPFIEWLYEEYNTQILDTILEVNQQLDLWNNDVIISLFEAGRNQKFKQHVWSLFIFSKWFKKVYMS